MTLTSVAQPNSKAAEFARLFELFDRVATRRSRALTGDTRELISADDIANVPAEFAPVLQNLSTVLSMRALRDEERARRSQATSIGRSRRNTVSGVPSSLAAGGPTQRVHLLAPSEEVVEEPDSPAFPFDERYPFTFKLMLHKLYDMDEWVAKVKNAVESSKSQFKPLAERVQNVVRETPTKERVEKRSSGRPPLSPTKSKTHTVMRHPHSPTSSKQQPETSRVVKKRCIGRRKSLSGPMSTGVWVYDAAISAVEVSGSRPAVEITLSEPRDGGSFADRRARHQSLAAMEGIHARDVARRKMKFAVPLANVQNCTPPQPTKVSFAEEKKEVAGEEGPAKKRRATMASTFDPEPFKRIAVKRPLCP